uniref:Uncharacterized protein n=1 Tax=Medicago truncatula TaxID=3880 RepID=A2Q5N2_MEDTR|nr:hypothetical protein MtrDRAFT_AC166313g14v2 [Medicago truncatula]
MPRELGYAHGYILPCPERMAHAKGGIRGIEVKGSVNGFHNLVMEVIEQSNICRDRNILPKNEPLFI